MIRGIDISTYQESKRIDYDALAKEIDFAILRIGFTGWGTAENCNLDKEFYAHYNELSKRGVKLGAYYFGVAMTPDMAKKEAEFVLKEVKDRKLKLEYGIWYDTENSGASGDNKNGHQFLSKTALTNVVDRFCSTIESAGFYCGIYASESWFTTKLDYTGKLKRYDYWVANWSNEPKIPYGMLQFSSTGKLKGYAGNLDMNVAKKDYPAIYKKMHDSETEVETPVAKPKQFLIFKVTTEPEKYPDFDLIFKLTAEPEKYPDFEQVEVVP